MKVTFLGGAEEVGASGIFVEAAGKRVLIDCGIRPSPKAHDGLAADQLPALSLLQSGSSKLDAILVTHAHTDHTGALELVLERFPDVPVYATAATIALTRVLHQDSRRIMQSRLDQEGELPLFDDVAVQRLMAAMIPVPFKTRVALSDELDATFFPAGHIAGAAMIGLESSEGRLLLSGDISISPQRTVDGARPPAFHPNAFIVESTYGGRLHANRAVQERKLVETVAQVTANGGKVLIPAFALGRAQEILLILNEYQRRGELPPIPVWADGMVRAICQTYSIFSDILPLALQEKGAQFFNSQIHPVASSSQRNEILWNPGPAVIVASSGMLAGGPSLSYARALAPKAENAILLTGYQDEESPGRRLQELVERGAGTIRLGGDKVDVQCHIASYSLSAHADESQIINLTETLDPEQVFLVHGDAAARSSLEKALSARQRIVRLPHAGQTFELIFDRPATYRKPEQMEDHQAHQRLLQQQRSEKMAEFSESVGKWLALKGEGATPVRCLAVANDHLWVEIAPGLEQAIFPENVLAVLGATFSNPTDLGPLMPRSGAAAIMEPNQALAAANSHFPTEARLRKSGYRLSEHILSLTFDFPDSACQRYADLIASLEQISGWQVEINPETNHNALNALVREVLPEGWRVTKGPSIYRSQNRVEVSIASQTSARAEISEISAKFSALSGWELAISETVQQAPPTVFNRTTGKRLEINAAYALIKSALESSTLYRTSLKGDEILLSFISPQIAARHQVIIAELAAQTGWAIGINPQPNQGAISEVARALVSKFGFTIQKGPSIFLEKSELIVTLLESPSPEQQMDIKKAFEMETGFKLNLLTAAPSKIIEPASSTKDIVEIPLNRIRLTPYQQSLSLDPAKLEKAIEHARQMGINLPIQVRRTRDGYILSDGLYRLRAAEALHLERIPALVE